MPICTMCGKRKPTIASGWIQCPKCKRWYCPDCFVKLRTKPAYGGRKRICARCLAEI